MCRSDARVRVVCRPHARRMCSARRYPRVGRRVNGDMDLNGDLIRPEHDELAPGQTCPKCGHRKPHERKPSSPNSKPRSYRVPLEEAEAHEEVLTEAAKFLGSHERPFWQFATYSIALALVLQDEKLRGFAQRGPA